MIGYYDLWTDEVAASKMLDAAVERYIAINLAMDKGQSTAEFATSLDQVKNFALDPSGDPIQELVDFSNELLQKSRARALSVAIESI